MATTIPGGAFLSADGQTWHSSTGLALTQEQITQAEALADKRTQASLKSELALQAQSISRVRELMGAAPVAAVAQALQIKTLKEESPPTPSPKTKGK
jgi:hypothetical protein